MLRCSLVTECYPLEGPWEDVRGWGLGEADRVPLIVLAQFLTPVSVGATVETQLPLLTWAHSKSLCGGDLVASHHPQAPGVSVEQMSPPREVFRDLPASGSFPYAHHGKGFFGSSHGGLGVFLFSFFVSGWFL